MDVCMYEWMDEWMVWMNGWMVTMNGLIDGWINRIIELWK